MPPPPELTEGERLMQQADSEFAKRAEPEALLAAIGHWERALGHEAQRAEAALRLARAEHFLGRQRLLGSQPELAGDALTHFTRGMQFAETALGPAAKQLQQARATERLDELFQPQAAPALYWLALNSWQHAQASGFAELAATADDADLTMRFCKRVAPDYDGAGPDRALGAMSAAAPAFARVDLESAQAHFENALGLAPDYLATRVLYAQTYAVAAQDRKVFEQQLATVLHTSIGPTDPHGAENEHAKLAASVLLARASEIFE